MTVTAENAGRDVVIDVHGWRTRLTMDEVDALIDALDEARSA